MPMKKRFWFFFETVPKSSSLVYMVLAISCSRTHADLPSKERRTELSVRWGDLREILLLTGVLRATEAENIVVPRTPSWQVQIRWLEEDGARVTAGQKIIEFDNCLFKTRSVSAAGELL